MLVLPIGESLLPLGSSTGIDTSSLATGVLVTAVVPIDISGLYSTPENTVCVTYVA